MAKWISLALLALIVYSIAWNVRRIADALDRAHPKMTAKP